MTKFALILTAWYSLFSEPEGSWKYVQTFGWFDDKAQCEQYATDEMNNAMRSLLFHSQTPFDTRRMLLKEMTYECLTEVEYIEKLKEKENVD